MVQHIHPPPCPVEKDFVQYLEQISWFNKALKYKNDPLIQHCCKNGLNKSMSDWPHFM